MGKSIDQYFEDVDLRIKANEVLYELGVLEGDDYVALEKLIGASVIHMTDDTRRILSLLAGPHGAVIYKMLKARNMGKSNV